MRKEGDGRAISPKEWEAPPSYYENYERDTKETK